MWTIRILRIHALSINASGVFGLPGIINWLVVGLATATILTSAKNK